MVGSPFCMSACEYFHGEIFVTYGTVVWFLHCGRFKTSRINICPKKYAYDVFLCYHSLYFENTGTQIQQYIWRWNQTFILTHTCCPLFKINGCYVTWFTYREKNDKFKYKVKGEDLFIEFTSPSPAADRYGDRQVTQQVHPCVQYAFQFTESPGGKEFNYPLSKAVARSCGFTENRLKLGSVYNPYRLEWQLLSSDGKIVSAKYVKFLRNPFNLFSFARVVFIIIIRFNSKFTFTLNNAFIYIMFVNFIHVQNLKCFLFGSMTCYGEGGINAKIPDFHILLFMDFIH